MVPMFVSRRLGLHPSSADLTHRCTSKWPGTAQGPPLLQSKMQPKDSSRRLSQCVFLSFCLSRSQSPTSLSWVSCVDQDRQQQPRLNLEGYVKWRTSRQKGRGEVINNNADYNTETAGASQYLSPTSTSGRIRNQWPTQSINTLRLKVTGQ